jgi:hypothetical protein
MITLARPFRCFPIDNVPRPIALFGLILLFAGIAYFILTKALIAHHGASSLLATCAHERANRSIAGRINAKGRSAFYIGVE